jgi:hypothetical protein
MHALLERGHSNMTEATSLANNLDAVISRITGAASQEPLSFNFSTI